MHVDELHPIFKECCSKEDGRYVLTRPFLSDGRAYATDGRIMVRTLANNIDTLDGQGEGHRPDPRSVGWEGPFASEASPIPELTEDEVQQCTCCDGRGEHQCGAMCIDCDGMGEIVKIGATEVGGVLLGNNYLRVLVTHGAQVHIRREKHKSKSPGSVRFVGDGWEGLLMPRAR